LHNHRHPFIAAILGHRVSPSAEVFEVIGWRHGHKNVLSECRQLEGNLLAGVDPFFSSDRLANILKELFAPDAGAHRGCRPDRVYPYPVEAVPARPSAHPPRKILARTGWALTLVQLGDAIGHRRSPLTPTPSIMPILLTPLGTALTTGPVTTARLDPTPTQRRLGTQTAAITTLRT
jgi:hypothetical protein